MLCQATTWTLIGLLSSRGHLSEPLALQNVLFQQSAQALRPCRRCWPREVLPNSSVLRLHASSSAIHVQLCLEIACIIISNPCAADISQGMQVPWTQPKWEVVAAVGGLKGTRDDWLVEKACELGAWSFRPLLTDRARTLGRSLT